MTQSYPLDLPSLQVTIASVDVTAFVLARTLSMHAVLGPQVDSASFAVKNPESYRAGSLTKPSVGQSVQILVQTSPSASFSPVYTGIISRVGEVKIAHKTVRWNIECVDNTHLLTRLLVVQNYQDQIVSDIVLDIARKYCGGVDTSGVQVTHGNTVQSITFSYKTPLDCFEELAGLVGYQWFIDPNNVLYFYDPASTLRVSAQSITDTSNNFDELTIEPQLDQVRNRVYVTGGMGLSSTVTETFDCDGIQDTFTLKHRDVVSSQIGMTADGKLGNFMTLSGSSYGGAAVNQLTAVRGIGDASLLPSGWLVDTSNAVVMRSVGTPIPPDGTRATFRYGFKTPVNVVQQNTASMQAVAQLDGSDWVTTVSGDNPLHWWRLNETSGARFHNRGSAGPTYSGMLIAGTPSNHSLNVTGPIIYDPTSRAIELNTSSVQIQTATGVYAPCNYTLECLAQLANAPVGVYSTPLMAQYNDFEAGDFISLSQSWENPASYRLMHPFFTVTGLIGPSFGRYDHIVARHLSGSGEIYVNNRRVGGPLQLDTFSSAYNMKFRLGAASLGAPPIRMAEILIYSGALSPPQIAEHYFAFKYGGIREHILTVNGETSYDACMQKANAELDKYSAVITKLTWTSFVPNWQVGDTVTINVTATNVDTPPYTSIGRTFSGTALIQEVIMRWLGAQRFQYQVKCQSTRYNPIDHARSLAAPRDPIVPNSAVGGLTLMTTFTEDTGIVIDGPVTHTIA